MVKNSTKNYMINMGTRVFDIRKSKGGWSIDEKTNGQWVFILQLSSKKACIEYIKKLTGGNYNVI